MRILINNNKEMGIVEVDLCVLSIVDAEDAYIYSYKYREGCIMTYTTSIKIADVVDVITLKEKFKASMKNGYMDLSGFYTEPGYSLGEGTEIDDGSDIEDGTVMS